MSIYDKSSLVLIPSGTKTGKVYSQKPTNGDGDFTFTRSSAATRVNADGNIEKETQNKLLYSNTFSNAAWTNVNSSETAGQSGYDGTNTAWKLIASGGNNDKIFQSVTQTGVVTFSIYVKKGNANFIAIEFGGFSYYNLQTGALGSSGSIISNKIEDVGGGWYRCSITVSISSTTNAQVYVANADNSTNTSNGDFVYIQDAQVEQGLVARDYIETTAAAVYGGIADNVPRLDYTDSSCPALLLEPQRRNITPYSEYFEGWNRVNTGVAVLNANEYTSPEGVSNAYEVEFTAGGASSQIYKVLNGLTTVTKYTSSIYVKYISGSGEDFQIVKSFGTAGVRCTFTNDGADLSVIAVGGTQANDFGKEPLENGWFRIWFTYASNSTNWEINISRGIYKSGSDVYGIYGFQLEDDGLGGGSAYPTSYIPTYGSSVTRTAELCGGAGNANTFNSTEGVLYAEISALADDFANYKFISLYDGTFNNFCDIYYGDASKRISVRFRSGGGSIINMLFAVSDITAFHKVAISWKLNEFKFFVNGVSRGLNTCLLYTSDAADE